MSCRLQLRAQVPPTLAGEASLPRVARNRLRRARHCVPIVRSQGGDAARGAGELKAGPTAAAAGSGAPEPSEFEEVLRKVLDEKLADVARKEEVDRIATQVDRIATQQGHLFECFTRIAGDRRNLECSYGELPLLAADLGLSDSELRAVFARLAAPAVLHNFRSLLAAGLRGIKDNALQAALALASWLALPPEPRTAAEWEAESAAFRQVLRMLDREEALQEAVQLWRQICDASLNDALAGDGPPGQALLQLLESSPGYSWPPATSLLMALAGSLQPYLELDGPLRVESGQGFVVVTAEEAEISGAAAGQAKEQLTLVIRAIGWLFAVAGKPIPHFVGTVIVPAAERRRAEKALQVRQGRAVALPEGMGIASVEWTVSWL